MKKSIFSLPGAGKRSEKNRIFAARSWLVTRPNIYYKSAKNETKYVHVHVQYM